ncbi:MAG: gamma-glutamyl-gamma-aminobutyrate hydrolase family protein [Patescibacteria group bacterium]
MKKKPIIGITISYVNDLERPGSPTMQGQFYTYIDAVVNSGGAPVFIPNLEDTQTLKAVYDKCDGILFSGGYDLTPNLYGGSSEYDDGHASEVRDNSEIQIMKWAEADDKPTLGICRGMQLMNVHRGGTLIQDLPDGDIDHMGDLKNKGLDSVSHPILIEPDSKLATILGQEQIQANSYHHQAIDSLGTGLRVVAKADDGMVEAVEDPSKTFWIGVQSHPESVESTTVVEWAKLFKAFIESANA